MLRSLQGVLLPCLLTLLLASCSVTSHITEGEVLYTGVDQIVRHPSDTVDAEVDEAVMLALEVPPTNALFGSAYRMSPLPVGLWVYNALYPSRETGLRHWLWDKFKSDPQYISQVNPRLRAQAAEAILKDEGYFDAVVQYDTVHDPTDSLQAKLSYDITYNRHSRLGNIRSLRSASARVDSIISHTQHLSLLHTGDRFSASHLEEEKNRISATLRDSGYFFFSPDYVKVLGDSTLAPNTVSLRFLADINGDVKPLRPCVIDSVFYHLDYGYGMKLQNFEHRGFMSIGYNGQQLVKTKYLRRALGFRRGALYNPELTERVKANLSRLNAFQYTTTEFEILDYDFNPQTTDPALDTLRLMLKIHAINAAPWSGGSEFGVVYKDNQQVGPGVTISAQRRNLFGGGEVFSMETTGSYEWSTGQGSGGNNRLNSFEFGTKLTYSIPRLPLQRTLFHADRNSPVSSRYSISVDWMRRGGLFDMIKSSGSMDYTFTRGKVHSFTLTPLRVTYVRTMHTTERFDSIVGTSPALQRSLENQFIPQFQFSWTYDNASQRQSQASHQYLRISLAEAGGLTDLMAGAFGKHKKQGERQFWDQRFSQFLKATAEFSNTHLLTPKSSFVTHIIAGVGYAYGNSTIMPYSEQFYIGGPNSLRGFSVRSIGPGTSLLSSSKGSNNRLYSVGDYKFEANLEYRFPITGSIYGALFSDAGNIWKFSNEFTSEAETLQGNPLAELAVDCGAGLRLDLGMLVVRFDVGVPLHDPNSTGSYFNCRHAFLRNLGYNLAVGYPF